MKKQKPKNWNIRKRRTFWARAKRNETLLIDIKKKLFEPGRKSVVYKLSHFQNLKEKIK